MTYIAWYYRKMEITFNTETEMFTLNGKHFYTIAGLADFFGYNFSEFRLHTNNGATSMPFDNRVDAGMPPEDF